MLWLKLTNASQIKCDSAKPCGNCQTYKRSCVYNTKPSNESSLAIENNAARKRSRRASQERVPPDGISSPTSSNNALHHRTDATEQTRNNLVDVRPNVHASEQQRTPINDRTISRVLVADDGRSSYHGQTSAFFELQENNNAVASQRLPSSWVQKALLAEAAIQRK